jgi:membrane protein YqaA with SNARE-associated domain
MARWQMSGVVLAPCIALIPNSPICSAITANLIGGCIFYWIDKWIFGKDNKDMETKKNNKQKQDDKQTQQDKEYKKLARKKRKPILREVKRIL